MSYDPCASDPADDRRVYEDGPSGIPSSLLPGSIRCLTCDGDGCLAHPTRDRMGIVCQSCRGEGWVHPGEHDSSRTGSVPEHVDESLEVTRKVEAR